LFSKAGEKIHIKAQKEHSATGPATMREERTLGDFSSSGGATRNKDREPVKIRPGGGWTPPSSEGQPLRRNVYMQEKGGRRGS